MHFCFFLHRFSRARQRRGAGFPLHLGTIPQFYRERGPAPAREKLRNLYLIPANLP